MSAGALYPLMYGLRQHQAVINDAAFSTYGWGGG